MLRPTVNNTNELRVNAYCDYYNYEFMLLNETLDVLNYEDIIYIRFHTPIYVPDFSMYYFNKIKKTNDRRIYDILLKLIYLNRGCNAFVRKKMVQYVLNTFVAKKKVDSEVFHDKDKMVPIMEHEHLMRILTYLLKNYDISNYIPDKKVYHLLEANNIATAKQKHLISMLVRWDQYKHYVEHMIDNAVDLLIELDYFTKITTGRIHKKKMVSDPKGKPVSYNTIKVNLSDYAIKRIKDTGSTRIFTDEALSMKLMKYIYSPPMSLNELVQAFEISKTTAIKFQKIKNSGQIEHN